MRRPPIRIRDVHPRHRPRLAAAADACRRRGLVDRARPPAGGHPAAAEHRRRLPHARIAPTCRRPAVVQGFARLLDRLDLLAQLVIAGPSREAPSSTSARPSALWPRRNRPAGRSPPVRHDKRGPADRDECLLHRGDRPPAHPGRHVGRRRPRWSPTSTTGPPPVPPGRSSRSSAESSSCSPGSRSRSGSPAAGWSRRSPG